MDKKTAIERFQKQIDKIESINPNERFTPAFKKWKRDTEVLIENAFGENKRHK